MRKNRISQPYDFIEYSKIYIEYSDKITLAQLSGLSIKKIYHIFNDGKGKKHALIIARAILKLLEIKGISDPIIKKAKKNFTFKSNK